MIKPITECKTVAELLADPQRWAKGYYAYDEHGVGCAPESDRACKFCLAGAVLRLNGPLTDSLEKLAAARRKLFPSFENNVAAFNDHSGTSHEMIMQLVKEAGV
jgi:hypothetical protein